MRSICCAITSLSAKQIGALILRTTARELTAPSLGSLVNCLGIRQHHARSITTDQDTSDYLSGDDNLALATVLITLGEFRFVEDFIVE